MSAWPAFREAQFKMEDVCALSVNLLIKPESFNSMITKPHSALINALPSFMLIYLIMNANSVTLLCTGTLPIKFVSTAITLIVLIALLRETALSVKMDFLISLINALMFALKIALSAMKMEVFKI